VRLFYPNTTTSGEGLHRVTLSIGSLKDIEKASIKTPPQDTSKEQVAILVYTSKIDERYRMLCSASLNTSKSSI
jgi:hypothetical protein